MLLAVVMLVPGAAAAQVPSVDPRVQEIAERWLRKAAPHDGAVVLSDVKTGRILAWASRGAGDRVATAFAPSASVFKLATVSALLDSGRANAGSTACYAGGERKFELADLRDVASRDTACIPLRTAVGHSVNLVIVSSLLVFVVPWSPAGPLPTTALRPAVRWSPGQSPPGCG